MTSGRVDLRSAVGSVELASPVMTASGTAGHGTELAAYGSLSELGAMVVKSLSAAPWPGNPPLRVHEVSGGMLNSVGLQGPGMAAWLEGHLPALARLGARVVVSLWGRSVDEFAAAATLLREALGADPAMGASVAAIEINVSCPNVEDRSSMFAHSASATRAAVAAVAAVAGATAVAPGSGGRPLWVKLSPNVADICQIAAAAVEGGAESLTLVNTLLGLALDVERREPVLGAGGGGLSGAALHPVAVRAVWECRQAFPDLGIIGSGGISRGVDAVEMLLAGADAVQVGTATFRDPCAPWQVAAELERWCRRHRVRAVRELVGGAQPGKRHHEGVRHG